MVGQSVKVLCVLFIATPLVLLSFHFKPFCGNAEEVLYSIPFLQTMMKCSEWNFKVFSYSESRTALIMNLRDTIKFTLENWNNPDIKASDFQSGQDEQSGARVKTKTEKFPATQQNENSLTAHPELRFCPFKQAKGDNSYVPTNCSLKVTRVEDVVTVILNFMKYPDQNTVAHVLHGLISVHPNIRVLAAWPDDRSTPKVDIKSIKFLTFAKSTQASKVWSTLIKLVQTTYVLVARDVNFMDSDIELERMLRVMSNLSRDAIIGGSTRTPNGHWRMSCDQMSLRNYTLAFKSGYKKSTLNGCVHCDYPVGPFLAEASNIGFNENELADDTAVFVNFFVNKRKSGVGVYVCPDAMFHVNPQRNIKSTDHWLATAKQLKVEIIVVNEEKIRLPCSEVGLPCYPYSSKGIALPPCCLRALSDEIAFILEACGLHNIYCDLRCGNLVGAVKFGSTIPWELDGDIFVLEDNFTAFTNLKPYFVKHGWTMSYKDNNDYVDFTKNSGFRIEVFSRSPLASTYYTSKGMKPTRVNLDGYWALTEHNPGRLVMRNYGMSVYKHAEHNYFHGKPPMARYSEKTFFSCPNPGFHACLDLYKTDGNIQFKQNFYDTFI